MPRPRSNRTSAPVPRGSVPCPRCASEHDPRPWIETWHTNAGFRPTCATCAYTWTVDAAFDAIPDTHWTTTMKRNRERALLASEKARLDETREAESWFARAKRARADGDPWRERLVALRRTVAASHPDVCHARDQIRTYDQRAHEYERTGERWLYRSPSTAEPPGSESDSDSIPRPSEHGLAQRAYVRFDDADVGAHRDALRDVWRASYRVECDAIDACSPFRGKTEVGFGSLRLRVVRGDLDDTTWSRELVRRDRARRFDDHVGAWNRSVYEVVVGFFRAVVEASPPRSDPWTYEDWDPYLRTYARSVRERAHAFETLRRGFRSTRTHGLDPLLDALIPWQEETETDA